MEPITEIKPWIFEQTQNFQVWISEVLENSEVKGEDVLWLLPPRDDSSEAALN